MMLRNQFDDFSDRRIQEMKPRVFNVSTQLKVSDDLSMLFNNEHLSDIKFVLNRLKLKLSAHKAILWARCPAYFCKLQHLMLENSINEIDITDMEDDIFPEFLRFVYTGTVQNIDNVSKKLIDIAEKYALNDLKNLCVSSLIKNLTVNNAIETLILANQLNAEQLKSSALKFINENAPKIIPTEGYTSLVTSHSNLIDQLYRLKIFPSRSSETKMESTSVLAADIKLKVSADMKKLLNDQMYSDVLIVLKDSTLYCAHKAILSARSPVFSSMFQHDMIENSTNQVIVKDIRDDVFRELLRFMYCGSVNDIHKMSCELLIAADRYALEDLKSLCITCMEKLLSVENAAKILILADQVNAQNLKLSAMKYINNFAISIFPTDGYKLLSKSYLYLIEELYRHKHGAMKP